MTAPALPGLSDTERRALREQLDRMLRNGLFQQSRRRKRFLEYIVNETLAGRTDRLKGYSIAVEVFDRPCDFDPTIDPVVRIEAARLRDRIREYYEGEGLHDPVRIELPKGGYAPVIEFRGATKIEAAASAIPVFGGANGASLPSRATALEARPSIAVLPFVNMSARRADDYLSDLITENIITALSRFRDLAVVASYSVFSYKGKGVRVPEIARELGVRFVLEGSVQKSKERVTITAQLIDGGTGAHLWAERFDRGYGDLLAVLDEVTEHIVGRLGSPYSGRLGKAWRSFAGGGTTGRLQAYDHLLAGLDDFDDYVPGCMVKARARFFKAIDLDPALGKAYAKIAFSHVFDVCLGWSMDPEHSLAEAHKYAVLATTRDDDEAWGHWALGYYYLFIGQHERALTCYRRALQLNSNDPDIMTDFGSCLSYSGRSQEAVEIVEKAMQINPHYPGWWLMTVGQVFFDARRYQDAIDALDGAEEMNLMANCLYLAASNAALGKAEEACAAVALARKLDAHLSISSIDRSFLGPYKTAGDREHLRINLLKAGVPE